MKTSNNTSTIPFTIANTSGDASDFIRAYMGQQLLRIETRRPEVSSVHVHISKLDGPGLYQIRMEAKMPHHGPFIVNREGERIRTLLDDAFQLLERQQKRLKTAHLKARKNKLSMSGLTTV